MSNQQILQAALLQTANIVENAIDAELEEDLDSLRAKRLTQLQEKSKKKAEWLAKGHGVYSELSEEKAFFTEVKQSERVVVHFYRESNMPCKVMDKHLSNLARIHLETKFLKISAERSPFLTERLKIWMLPTVVLVKDGKTEHSIIGLDELGGSEDFSQEMLEWKIGSFGVIDYDGPQPEFDAKGKKKYNITTGFGKQKSIQGSSHNYGSESDED